MPTSRAKAYERAEVRRADLVIEAAPVVLDADGDHGPLHAAPVARGLQIGEVRRKRPPEGGDRGEELGIRLARASADPAGQTAAGEADTHAGTDADHDLEASRARELDRAPQVAGAREHAAPRGRLMQEPRRSDHDGVESGVPEPAEGLAPEIRVDKGCVEAGARDGKAGGARTARLEQETLGIERHGRHGGTETCVG